MVWSYRIWQKLLSPGIKTEREVGSGPQTSSSLGHYQPPPPPWGWFLEIHLEKTLLEALPMLDISQKHSEGRKTLYTRMLAHKQHFHLDFNSEHLPNATP